MCWGDDRVLGRVACLACWWVAVWLGVSDAAAAGEAAQPGAGGSVAVDEGTVVKPVGAFVTLPVGTAVVLTAEGDAERTSRIESQKAEFCRAVSARFVKVNCDAGVKK